MFRKYLGLASHVLTHFETLRRTCKKNIKHKNEIPFNKRYAFVHNYLKMMNENDFKVLTLAQNIENVPDSSCLIAPNHVSMYDPVVLLSLLNHPSFLIGKKETEKMLYVGKVMKSIDCLFLDRTSLRDGIRVVNSAIKHIQENNSSLIVFPEGTRTKDRENFIPGDFHGGTFKVAIKNKMPIIPVCLFGTQKILHKSITQKRYPVIVKFCTPITYEEYKDLNSEEIAEKVRNIIISELETVKIQYEKADKFYNSKEYLKNK